MDKSQDICTFQQSLIWASCIFGTIRKITSCVWTLSDNSVDTHVNKALIHCIRTIAVLKELPVPPSFI